MDLHNTPEILDFMQKDKLPQVKLEAVLETDFQFGLLFAFTELKQYLKKGNLIILVNYSGFVIFSKLDPFNMKLNTLRGKPFLGRFIGRSFS